MAAMVAHHHHHPGFWQERRSSDQAMHMSMSGYIPNTAAAVNPVNPRTYQPTHIDLTIPVFGNPVQNHTPFPNHAYGFETLSVNPYNTQHHHVPLSYPPSLTHSATFPGTLSHASSTVPHVREAKNSVYGVPHHSPSIKTEESSPVQPSQLFNDRSVMDGYHTSSSSDSDKSAINFSTDVDVLMKAIQAKAQVPPLPKAPQQQQQPQPQMASLTDESRPGNREKKRYFCEIPECKKSFYQKTHLEIHKRAHTGIKPFMCKEPGCGQTFSQLGNLKTHERRHTGERPYSCELCGKTFAQRGNVRAHKIVHDGRKPFTCKLDNCGKQFTQLGNLKSHQNKFHPGTLKYLTTKFANLRDGDPVTGADMDLWDYFSRLYKNSNKGIKGRGKDRRISTAPINTNSNLSSAHPAHTASAPVSPTHGVMGGRVMKRGPSSVQMGSRSSRSSTVSEDDFGATGRGGPVRTHAAHAYDFNGHVGPGGYGDSAFPERKMF